jgi:hypothetical protein
MLTSDHLLLNFLKYLNMTTQSPPFETEPTSLIFSAQDLILLGKTADSLSAYLGAAVLAEVGESDGAEWVIFAQALAVDETPKEGTLLVQLGGKDARLLGGTGGIEASDQPYDCSYLWSIQITEYDDERYVKLDSTGEVVDTSPTLDDLLPFSIVEPEYIEDDIEVEESESDSDADDSFNASFDTSDDDKKPPTRH